MIDSIVNLVTSYLQQFGIPFGILLIILESIIPALPLGVFIAFNMMAFGGIIGFLISWSATCIGCILSYFLFRKISKISFINKLLNMDKLSKVMARVEKINFSNLVLIIALPFTPAFLINIACGLVRTNLRKFIGAILIGKLSIVYFWGFVGKSLLQSITDIKTIIIVILLLLISYILSKIVNKKFNLE